MNEREMTPKEREISSMTWMHISRVGELMAEAVRDLIGKAFMHDRSKVELPEAEGFALFTESLRGLTYGSEEYKASLAALKPTLDHHYANNEHHPEHFTEGIEGMTLLDLVEMICDWKASTERTANGNIMKSIEINSVRFNISPQTKQILKNTVVKFGWDK